MCQTQYEFSVVSTSLTKHCKPHLLLVDPVNTDEYRRDNRTTSCGGNVIDIHVMSGSLMSKRWQSNHQDRIGRPTPCLFRNFIVFKMSTRRKSQTNHLLTNQCSRITRFLAADRQKRKEFVENLCS
jgi:hypothetical protein